MIKSFRRITRIVNNFFIAIVLFIFYFVAVGLSFLIYKTMTIFKKSEKKESYWEDVGDKNLGDNYFSSSY
ncbi:MAG: hypothetical protein A2857_02225 [Candidatus Levybacteria bacterium RIFCSPHIGHO2_01_FULL_36_15]|nr:MAG: hypothetical protein A2857_02225 [Candidatus Levybacteria bacterium RIFCSPHIGHO2_01_FULL_36_15]